MTYMLLNANQLLKKGIKQVIEAGIQPGHIHPEVILNSRAKTRFGVCRKTPGEYDFQIELNSELLKAKEEKALNTVVHEILHSVKGCMNHGAIWTNYANKMNRKFGYDISRTSTYEKLGLVRPKPKYLVQCQGCGVEVHRSRRSKLITHINDFACGTCNGKLKLM